MIEVRNREGLLCVIPRSYQAMPEWAWRYSCSAVGVEHPEPSDADPGSCFSGSVRQL